MWPQPLRSCFVKYWLLPLLCALFSFLTFLFFCETNPTKWWFPSHTPKQKIKKLRKVQREPKINEKVIGTNKLSQTKMKPPYNKLHHHSKLSKLYLKTMTFSIFYFQGITNNLSQIRNIFFSFLILVQHNLQST